MKACYDNKPITIEAVGNGSFLYRYNIQDIEVVREEKTTTQFQCDEVTVWGPLTSNKITDAVISSRWESNYEQKLINEYNAAVMGLYDAEVAELKKKSYSDFLAERANLKTQIDSDCSQFGIK